MPQQEGGPTWQEDEDGAILPGLALVYVGHQRLQQVKVQAVFVQQGHVAQHAGAAQQRAAWHSRQAG